MYVFAAECYVIRLEFQFLPNNAIQRLIHSICRFFFQFKWKMADGQANINKRKIEIIETHK